VLTRKEPLDVDNVNLSVIAHVTPEELLSNLTATDRANGFANRFLILLVRRSKFLPEGGGEVDLDAIVKRLHAAVKAVKGRGRLIVTRRRRSCGTRNTAGSLKAVTDCAAHCAAGLKPTC
jgi:hypothetical protein